MAAASSSADTSSAGNDGIKLSIFCPIRPARLAVPSSSSSSSSGNDAPAASTTPSTTALFASPEHITVPPELTVKELKVRLEEHIIPGGPLREAQTLIWRGRRLRDEERLADIVREVHPMQQQQQQQQQQPEPAQAPTGHVLHLSVTPTEWKALGDKGPAAAPVSASNNVGIPSTHLTRAAAERLAALSTSLTGGSSGSGSGGPGPAAPVLLSEPSPLDTSAAGLASGSVSPTTVTAAPFGPATTSTSASASVASGSTLPFTSPPWMAFYTHLAALSSSQRYDLLYKLIPAELHYTQVVLFSNLKQRTPFEPLRPSSTSGPSTAADAPSADVTTGLSAEEMGVEDPALEQQIEGLLSALGFTPHIESVAQHARETFLAAEAYQAELLGAQGSATTASQIVTIGGLPFLLQVPEYLQAPQAERLENHVRLKRCKAVQQILGSMLSAIRSASSSGSSSSSGVSALLGGAGGASAAAYARLGRTGVGAGATEMWAPGNGNEPHPLDLTPAEWNARQVRARALARHAGIGIPPPLVPPALGAGGGAGAPAVRARVVLAINLEDVIGIVVPLAFLAVKLGFLIYIFGRHASPTKRNIMCGLAAFWVLWEGYAIRRRQHQRDLRARLNAGVMGQMDAQAQLHAQAHAQGQQAGAMQQPLNAQGQPQPQAPAVPGPAARGGGLALPPLVPGQAEPPLMAELRERQARHERRAARNAAAAAVAAQREGRAPPAPGVAEAAMRELARYHPAARPSPSRLTPQYWMRLVANVGLAEEARELGVSSRAARLAANAVAGPAAGPGRPETPDGGVSAAATAPTVPAGEAATDGVPDVNVGETAEVIVERKVRTYLRTRPFTLSRVLHFVLICIVLFIGTLIPEIERLRKRAIEKRERKMRELELLRVGRSFRTGRAGQPLPGIAHGTEPAVPAQPATASVPDAGRTLGSTERPGAETSASPSQRIVTGSPAQSDQVHGVQLEGAALNAGSDETNAVGAPVQTTASLDMAPNPSSDSSAASIDDDGPVTQATRGGPAAEQDDADAAREGEIDEVVNLFTPPFEREAVQAAFTNNGGRRHERDETVNAVNLSAEGGISMPVHSSGTTSSDGSPASASPDAVQGSTTSPDSSVQPVNPRSHPNIQPLRVRTTSGAQASLSGQPLSGTGTTSVGGGTSGASSATSTRPVTPAYGQSRVAVRPHQRDNDSLHLGVNADGGSTPTTPLLSPALADTTDEEDGDDEPDDADGEVGMILF